MTLLFTEDESGFPMLEAANVPNSGITKTSGNTTGNNAHDAASGKFGEKPDNVEVGKEVEETPGNLNPLEYKRMLDAARDAAREMDLPQEGDIKEFLEGRAKNPGQVDIAGFLVIVKEQKLSDLVDIIDQEIRTRGEAMRTGRRRVRVVSPKGYVRRAFSALTEDGVAELMHRLEARGHDEAEVEAFVLGKAKPEKHDIIREKKVAIAASDDFEPSMWWFTGDEDEDDQWLEPEEPTEPQLPVINLSIEAPKQGAIKVTPVRDKKTGAIEYALHEPVEAE
jgi:hypothetical protein